MGRSWEKVGEKVGRKLGGSWGDILGENWEKVGGDRFKLGRKLDILGPLNQSISIAQIAVWFYTLFLIRIQLFLDKVFFEIGNVSF